jgi:hypothetical protein
MSNLKQLVEVEWIDIISEMRKDLDELDEMPTEKLFAKCKSYGTLYREDEHGIVIMSEVATDHRNTQIDYTAIPKGVIIRIIRYNQV